MRSIAWLSVLTVAKIFADAEPGRRALASVLGSAFITIIATSDDSRAMETRPI
jgi:hypothetical protein